MNLRLEIGSLAIHYDSDYGCDHRYGWSWAWRGIVGEQFLSLHRMLWCIWREKPWRWRYV